MSTESKPAAGSSLMLWSGRIISTLPVLMLLMSAAMKFSGMKMVAEGMAKQGWDPKVAIPLGITELVCTILYAIPQTSVLGAILLTGYMGGAIATHARMGEGFYIQAAFGVVIWLGIFLREPRLRAILPLRS